MRATAQDDGVLADLEALEALAERVRSRSIGLLVMPGLHGGGVLDQPAMQALLPVAKAKRIEGEPVPGVSADEAPFFPTAAGLEHPATRIVPFKGWSERIWAAQRLAAATTAG